MGKAPPITFVGRPGGSCVACQTKFFGPATAASHASRSYAYAAAASADEDLLRPCLGCGRSVRGKPRCVDCQRAIVGDWCPGRAGRPAHSSADLTADHVKEVAAGGKPDGRLIVRCRSCNAARSAHLARRAFRVLTGDKPHDPAPAGIPDALRAHRPGTEGGPVVP